MRRVVLRELVAALALGIICLPATAWADEPAVFTVRAGVAQGTAFLAEGVPGIPGPAIVTALHVVGGAQLIELRIANCKDGEPTRKATDLPDLKFGRAVLLWVWPGLDLVAFPVSLTPSQRSRWKPKQLSATPVTPQKLAEVQVWGTGEFDVCPDGSGTFRYAKEASSLIQHLNERSNYQAGDLGTLSGDAVLLYLASTGVPGVSGGPVLNESGQLIGMYQGGGTKGYSSNWAVQISVDDLTRFAPRRIRLDQASRVARAKLTQSQIDDFVVPAAHERPTGAFLGVQASTFFELRKPAARGLFLGGFAYAPIAPGLSTSVGLLVGLGVGVGKADRTISGPLSSVAQASQPIFQDVLGSIGVGVRGWQQRWARLGVAVGWRLGARFMQDSPFGATADFIHGPQLSMSPCLSLSLPLSLCFNGGVGALWRRSEAYQIALGSRSASSEGIRLVPDVSIGAFFAGALGRTREIEVTGL